MVLAVTAVIATTLLTFFLPLGQGDARLVEPPMRSSYWREGIPSAPINDKEDLLNCGGFEVQWTQNAGKCGPCGDPWGTFPENQSPGKYSQFAPQREYESGTLINATVYTEPNMLGWFEFRLCPRKDDSDAAALQACFDQTVLQIEESQSSRFYPGSGVRYSDFHVHLPPGLACDHCLLQWRYHTGYRSNSERAMCPACLGCGPQEEYYNCADIRITPLPSTPLPFGTTPSTVTETTLPASLSTTARPATPTTTPVAGVSNVTDPGAPDACTPSAKMVECEPKGIHRLVPRMESWCLRNCQSGKCHDQFCACYCNYTAFKIQIDASVFNRVTSSPSLPLGGQPSTTQDKLCYLPLAAWAQTPGMAGYCAHFCPSSLCATMCHLTLC